MAPVATSVTVPSVRARKARAGAEPLVMVTAYDAPGARMVADGGADLIWSAIGRHGRAR